MNNKIFFILMIKTILGSDESLPQLTWRQSLKQISEKDSFSAILLGTSLAFLIRYEALQKNKSFLDKASTVMPFAISIGIMIPGEYIYLGKTNSQTAFTRNFFWNDAKNNIFLERISELAKKNPEGAYDLCAKRYGVIQKKSILYDKKILKSHESLFNKFTEIALKREQEAIATNEEIKKSFQYVVNGLNVQAERKKLLETIFGKFTQESPNEAFGKIFVEKITSLHLDPTDVINDYQEKDKNIYFICFVKFVFIEYTKEAAIEEIKKIINNTNWTDNIDEELGRGIRAFMEKNKITNEEATTLINNNKTLRERRKNLVLSIFQENVFSQVKEESPKQ